MFRLFAPTDRSHRRRRRPHRASHAPKVEPLENRRLLSGDGLLPPPIAPPPEYSWDLGNPAPPTEPSGSVSVYSWDFGVPAPPTDPEPSEAVSEVLPPPTGDDLVPFVPADPGNGATEVEPRQDGDEALPPTPTPSPDSSGGPGESAPETSRARAGSTPDSPVGMAAPRPSPVVNPPGTPSPPQPQINPNQGTIGSVGTWISSHRAESLQDVIKRVGTLPTTTVAYHQFTFTNPRQGNNLVVDGASLRADQLVGTTGAQTCIGLIVRDSNNRIYAFHFEAGDDVASTMASAFAGMGTYAYAALFGGDGSQASDQTLEEVQAALSGYTSIHIVGFSDTPGLWIDRNGLFVVTTSDVATSNDNLSAPPLQLPPPMFPPGWPISY
jgi:hypothetical protein